MGAELEVSDEKIETAKLSQPKDNSEFPAHVTLQLPRTQTGDYILMAESSSPASLSDSTEFYSSPEPSPEESRNVSHAASSSSSSSEKKMSDRSLHHIDRLRFYKLRALQKKPEVKKQDQLEIKVEVNEIEQYPLTPENKRRQKLLGILQCYLNQDFERLFPGIMTQFPSFIIKELKEQEREIQRQHIEKWDQDEALLLRRHRWLHVLCRAKVNQMKAKQTHWENYHLMEIKALDGSICQKNLPRSGARVCNAIIDVLQTGNERDDETYKKLLSEMYEILTPKTEPSFFDRMRARNDDTVRFNKLRLDEITTDLKALYKIPVCNKINHFGTEYKVYNSDKYLANKMKEEHSWFNKIKRRFF